MNKEYLTYIIIGIVAVVIIIFLINSNLPKQEITSPPILTLPPINTETSNLINIYDVSNNSILNPITTTLPPITTTLPPITTTLPPITTTLPPITTTLPPITTTLAPVSTTTTRPPFTTTLAPVSSTTTRPPISTTTLAPVSTTLSPAQRSADIFASKQAELERKIKEQKQKEEDDLFNTPFIPVFNRDDWEAFIPDEGFYQIRYFGYLYYPCYNLGYNGPGTYQNGGNLGSLLDNNRTTSVQFDTDWRFEYNYIVITMPIFKTFNGKINIEFNTPWNTDQAPYYGEMLVFTANSFTNDNIKNDQRDWYGNYKYSYDNFFRKINKNNGNSFLEYAYLDNITIPGQNGKRSWDLYFRIPFNSIIIATKSQYRYWISDIRFEKSRSLPTSIFENPDFFAKFGSFTTSTLFKLDGWTLASSVKTYDNEGLASILTNNINPVAFIKEKNYPRVAGFISNSVIIQIGIPSPRKLRSAFWYGVGNDSGRNARNVHLFASNTDWYNNLFNSRSEPLLGQFTVDKNSSSTNPTKFFIDNPQPFSFFYFHILDNYGDSSVKIDRIFLIFDP